MNLIKIHKNKNIKNIKNLSNKAMALLVMSLREAYCNFSSTPSALINGLLLKNFRQSKRYSRDLKSNYHPKEKEQQLLYIRSNIKVLTKK